MDRRSFLGLTSATVAAVVVGTQTERAQASIVEMQSPASLQITERGYSIGNSELCVDWRWMREGWSMSSRDGVSWDDDGPLNQKDSYWPERIERGRQLIITHFGLQQIADQLPLEAIALTSPTTRFAIRRSLEQIHGLPYKEDMISDRGGDHCSAEFCA